MKEEARMEGKKAGSKGGRIENYRILDFDLALSILY